MSLALEVCNIAERHVGADRLPNVVEVGIEVGDAAGIEADNLVFWLETLLTHPPFRAARPALTRVAGDVLRVSYLEVDDDGSDD
jgi:Zn finger protein HypA/HybF involved in hydrogenase expression